MTDFFIKSTICMTALLAVYHIFLKKEKIHHFNRLYLLFALTFSLAVPFITIEIIRSTVQNPIAIAVPYKEMINKQIQVLTAKQSVNYIATAAWLLYSLIMLLLLIRFCISLNHFIKKIKNNTRIQHGSAILVLVPEQILPHTFLNYIFLNKKEYEHNTIESELYTHELTHVKQKHTIDILCIEVLKIVFWFNPIVHLYKKAIQLNHEFLADEKVVSAYNSTLFYQKLLLEKAEVNCTFQLASNLTYSITKQRLLMMTKSTSRTKSVLLKTVLAPAILIGLFLMLSLKKVDNSHAGKTINTGNVNTAHPSQQQWTQWKNDENTVVYINNWPMKRSDLENFNPSDLVSYSSNYIKKGTNKNNPDQQEVFLYTQKGFEDHYNSLEWPKPIEYKEIQNLKIEEGC